MANPEVLLKNGGGFEKLWKNPAFTSRIISVVWDEAHCISSWADFRPEYKEAGRLRYFLPHDIPYYVVSATLPSAILSDVMTTLQMQMSKTYFVRRSNDRSNVHITVRKILHPLNSFRDLKFVLQNWKPGDDPPPKFIIFCDSIRETVAIGKYLRKQLPPEYREKVKWFHANMSKSFREAEVQAVRDGRTWGLCCTDSFGMVSNDFLINMGSLPIEGQGLDLPDIKVVIQWRVRCGMCTLWQRFGRGARSPDTAAVAILFAEARHFDDEKEKARKAKAKRAEGKRRAAPSEATLTRAQKVVIRTDGQGRPYSEVASINLNAASGFLSILDTQLAPETTSNEELR